MPIQPKNQPQADLPMTGLRIYRASRLERLLEPLDALLQQVLPANVLAPQTVIAAHPGMKQWLAAALAQRRGRGGILANLEVELASTWLDRLARTLLGASVVSVQPFTRERLRWRIHQQLMEVDDAAVASYCRGADAARRRFQLADRLAQVFTQYLVYRPHWLRQWEAGNPVHAQGSFQPELWRRLCADIDGAHRAQVIARLAHALQRDGGKLPVDPLHVFGTSHLPRAELELLQAVARHRPVLLYVPDPCTQLWEDLPGQAELARLAFEHPFEDASEGSFLGSIGHPLLASWGRMGQHFMLQLNRIDARADVRHWEDEQALPESTASLLHVLQQSVRALQPELLTPAVATPADRSLQVHACHTRLRELEVLRDSMLRARLDDPSLQPSDMAVMAPDIGAYVPLLPAVFGPPGRHAGSLPYHLADVALARSHPLLDAFRQVLALAHARLDAPQVIDLLQVPQVAAALGLTVADVDTLQDWLHEAGAAWGLDAHSRAQLDLPAIPEHSFAWAMDRLLAGHVYGQPPGAGRAVVLPDGGQSWPVAGVHGPQANVLGALDGLLVEIATLQRQAQRSARASEWSLRLERLLDTLFRVDSRDAAAREAQGVLRRLLRSLALETAAAGDPELEFDVVREVLTGHLDAAPERQQFLMGGVTFCGMVPQRAIPFRFIAVLGLNDGEFPRPRSDAGLNLMLQAGNRELGDRDPRSEDRYLFLETLMSARERLHLSYVGEGVHDGKPRNPAAPLAELLALLAARCAAPAASTAQAAQATSPWHLRHPLQPFDARYFLPGEQPLFSFDAALRDLADGAPRAPFLAAPASASDAPVELELDSVLSWYRRPARSVLQEVLDLRLDALDTRELAAEEPLQARVAAVERAARRILLDVLVDGEPCPEQPPDWLRLTGKLPSGRLGESAWREEWAKVRSLLEVAGTLPLFAAGPPQRAPQRIRCVAAGHVLQGELLDVLAHDGALWLLDVHPGKAEARLDFKARIPLFLQWAMLRLATPDPMPVHACILVQDPSRGGEHAWRDGFVHWNECFLQAQGSGGAEAGAVDAPARMRADLQRRIDRLVGLYLHARTQPPWYFPRTSWAARSGDCARAVEQAWTGAGNPALPGERDEPPGYARLLAAGQEFASDTPAYAALCALAQELAQLIDLATPDAHPAPVAREPADAG